MHFIIETSNQLEQFFAERQGNKCYISIISGNDNFHPLLSDLSLIYIRDDRDKGFVFCIDHNEGLHLQINEINDVFNLYEYIFVYDKKQFIHYFPNHAHTDEIGFSFAQQKNLSDYNTSVHHTFYSKFYFKPNINKIIPIVKHYEKQENIYNALKDNISITNSENEWQKDFTEVFYKIEKQGLKINNETFSKYFEPNWNHYSIKDNRIYTRYNLFNATGRPSNAFNGINFGALPKDNNCRKSFVADKDCFLLEVDYKAFHLYLLAGLIQYKIVKDIYKELGKQLGIEDYDEIKKKVYQILYTDHISEYSHIEFFKKIESYKNKLWESYRDNGFIPGFSFTIDKKTQIIPCVLQSLETTHNITILKLVMNYIHLNQLKSRIVLYCYDSFLIQYYKGDGKDHLLSLFSLFKDKNKFFINVKIGDNYKEMKTFDSF